MAAVGSADKELRWYDGLYHEIFNETIKEEVFSDLDAWLKKHL
ncbi:MAG: alpha-beta hydrolase superfamily lysophospholipase [Myxococcota bacterium]